MSSELDLDFTTGTAPAGVSVTRSGSAWYFNSSGVLTSAGTNSVRLDYDPITLVVRGMLAEASKTQSIRNATGSAGLVAGSPGTVPTNWVQQANATGVSRTIIGSGTVNGMPYVDFQYSGTATASDSVLFFEPSSGVATVNATTWTSSLYLALIGGSLTNVTCKQGMRFRAAAGANIGTQIYETSFVPDATLRRYERTATGSDATIAFVAPSLCLTCASGAVNLTLRISIPQLELGLFASSPMVSTTATITRGNEQPVYSSVTFLNAAAGTMVTEWQVATVKAAGSQVSASLDDNSTNNRFQLFATNSSGTTGFAMVDATVSQVNFTDFSAPAVLTTYRHGAAWSVNDTTTGRDGTVRTSDTVCTIPAVTQLRLGQRGGDYLDGWLRRYRYWPTRYSNTDLASLTSAATSTTGTAANTLDALTSAASGLHFVGSGANTLDALTSAASGTFIDPISGTAAASLDALVGVGSGLHFVGAGDSLLDDLTSAAVGTNIEPRTGAGASSLEDLVGAGSGSTVAGTGGATLADLLAVSAEGWSLVYGSPAETLDALIADGVGYHAEFFVGGFAGEVLDALTCDGAGAHGVGSSSAVVLEALVGEGAGVRGATGAGSATLADLGSAAIGWVPVTGSGASSLPDLVAYGYGSAYAARRVRTVRLGAAQRRTISLNATVRQQIGVS